MKLWAPLIAAVQFDSQPGNAHSVITLEKPASLPPIVIVTQSVPLVRLDTWLLRTFVVVAPEHAANTRSVLGRCVSTSDGYAYTLFWHRHAYVLRFRLPE